MDHTSVFFGHYLLQAGKITDDQLQEALDFQEEHNQKLGELAVSLGYLTAAQAALAAMEQKNQDLPLGVILLRKGFISPRQLDDLLFTQIVSTTHVGEALVELNHLAPQDLARLLNEFNAEEQARQRLIAENLDHLPGSSLVRAGIEALHRAFLRFAHSPTTVLAVGETCVARMDWTFLVWVELQNRPGIQMTVNLSEKNAMRIGAKLAPSERHMHCTLRCLGRNNLFFTIVKRYLVILLARQGHAALRSGMRKGSVPNDGHRTADACVRLASPVGLIVVRFIFS